MKNYYAIAVSRTNAVLLCTKYICSNEGHYRLTHSFKLVLWSHLKLAKNIMSNYFLLGGHIKLNELYVYEFVFVCVCFYMCVSFCVFMYMCFICACVCLCMWVGGYLFLSVSNSRLCSFCFPINCFCAHQFQEIHRRWCMSAYFWNLT